MKKEFEYRNHETTGDEWKYYGTTAFNNVYDIAGSLAEKYWDEGDQEDVYKFKFVVEIREKDRPEEISRVAVTGDYTVNFYCSDLNIGV